MKNYYLLIVLLFVVSGSSAQGLFKSNKAKLEIINRDSSITKVKIKLGSSDLAENPTIMARVNTELRTNNIDCPPKRFKLADNVWLCGDGKKIVTNDARLKAILTSEWKDEE